MILVDSNVLIDLIQNDAKWADWSEAQLRRLRSKEKLAINAVIFAELAVNYNTVDELTGFLDAASISTLTIPPEAAFLAGHAFLRYRRRRGVKTGVLPDFLIGAHAQSAGMTLLTRDSARYVTYFSAVPLICPNTAGAKR